MIFTGSISLARLRPDLGIVNKDIDVFTVDTYHGNEWLKDNKFDVIPLSQKVYDKLLEYCVFDVVWTTPPDVLLTIKMSHLSWDDKWSKTKRHIIGLINLGHTPIPDLYEVLKEYWLEVKGNKDFLSLKKSKGEFFNDFVTYTHDHDYLHELVAFPNTPVYTKCLKDGEDVLICKESFNKLPHNEQIAMFREEITVIAIERWLTQPKTKGKISWYEAYSKALKLTITNLTKNWANDFVIFNLTELSKPKYSMFEYALNKLGVVMSKVDMKVFEEIEATTELSLSEVILSLASDEYEHLDIMDSDRYKHLDAETGGEGAVEHCYGVFSIDGVIYKAEWSYYSYDGWCYDGIESTLRVVTPKEKTITIYE